MVFRIKDIHEAFKTVKPPYVPLFQNLCIAILFLFS